MARRRRTSGKWTKGRFDQPTLKNDGINLAAAIGVAAAWVAGPATWFKMKGVPAFLVQFGIPYALGTIMRWDNLKTATAAVGATHLMYYNLDDKMTEWGFPIWALDKENVTSTVKGLSGASVKTLPSGEQVVYYEGGMSDYVGEGQQMLGEYVGEGDPMLGEYFDEGNPMLGEYFGAGMPAIDGGYDFM